MKPEKDFVIEMANQYCDDGSMAWSVDKAAKLLSKRESSFHIVIKRLESKVKLLTNTLVDILEEDSQLVQIPDQMRHKAWRILERCLK